MAYPQDVPRSERVEPIVDSSTLAAALDNLPMLVFLVDDDVRILHANRAAAQLGEQGRDLLLRRAGDALGCLNAIEAPGGCGTGARCRSCPIRTSVREAMETGKLLRERVRFQRVRGGVSSEGFFVVSSSPLESGGRRLVVLTLEDVSEVIALQAMLPICCYCHRVRDEQNYWAKVEDYVSRQLHVDWSHAICEACMEEHFPDDSK
jgi:PAS domain-containing protein